MKDILKTVLVLSIIALVAGGLLGIINHFTQIDESEALARKIDSTGIYTGEDPLVKLSTQAEGISQGYTNGSLKNVFQGGDQYIIHCGGEGGYGGVVELLVNIEDNKIKKIVSYSAEETPGLGTKAFKDDYLSQYYDKDLVSIQSFVLTKKTPESDEIVAVTGASKSSGAVVNAVNVAVTWYLSYMNNLEDIIDTIEDTGIYTGTTDLSEVEVNLNTFNADITTGALKGVFSGENCYILHTSGVGGYGGDIELFIKISADSIDKIVLYRSSETPGRTPSALSEDYYSQFYDVDLEAIEEYSLIAHAVADGDIEAVTSATKSSRGVLNAVNIAVKWYTESVMEVGQ